MTTLMHLVQANLPMIITGVLLAAFAAVATNPRRGWQMAIDFVALASGWCLVLYFGAGWVRSMRADGFRFGDGYVDFLLAFLSMNLAFLPTRLGRAMWQQSGLEPSRTVEADPSLSDQAKNDLCESIKKQDYPLD